MKNEIQFTRQQYLDKECTHRQYYAQFVEGSGALSLVKNALGKKILASANEHFNDIPLAEWDRLAPFTTGVAQKMKLAGDSLTLSGSVCVLKEAAQQIKEEQAAK